MVGTGEVVESYGYLHALTFKLVFSYVEHFFVQVKGLFVVAFVVYYGGDVVKGVCYVEVRRAEYFLLDLEAFLVDF